MPDLEGSPVRALSAWLYYPALLALILRIFLPKNVPVIWHIRSLPFGGFLTKPARYLTQRLLAPASRMKAVTIISNSDAARRAHQDLGYETERWFVIPNAIDADRYRPDPSRRLTMRHALALDEEALVLGAVGRNVPEKAYQDLIAAFAQLRAMSPASLKDRLHLIIAGRGVALDTEPFSHLIAQHQMPKEAISLLGARSDIAELMTAFDVFVMPSRSESFPNALVEAMSTSLPAIATDVGDCHVVLDQDDLIVPKANPKALAEALLTFLSLPEKQRSERGAKNRARVIACYSPDAMVQEFERVFALAQATDAPNLK